METMKRLVLCLPVCLLALPLLVYLLLASAPLGDPGGRKEFAHPGDFNDDQALPNDAQME
jgi:hypothetical protein